MLDELIEAREYLTPPPFSFWQWSEGGGVITWDHGQTIIFRAELIHVLESLAGHGLPRLGALLLLMAATRDNWMEGSRGSMILQEVFHEVSTTSFEKHADCLRQHLDRIHALERPLRATVAARATLAELVFEANPIHTSPGTAAQVIRLLREGLLEEIVHPSDLGYSFRVCVGLVWDDLDHLSVGLWEVTPEAIAMRLRTGLDEPVQPAEVELPPAQRTRVLLARMEEDEELCGLARLTRNLMAAVTLPRGVSDRDDLPIGGVSDISNRGPLDRLLLSELAYDDLTLSVRVAMNEALYLRRELPPRTPPRQRIVLLEAGIRSWGVPRVFATVVALALAATTDNHTQVVCYRAEDEFVIPVDLTTREGVVAHLEALQPEAHPGGALAAFQATVAENESVADVVMVMSEEVFIDHEFQKVLTTEGLLPLLVATVNRDGLFHLLHRSVQGSKTLREATLNLDDLFSAPKRKTASLVDRDHPRDLPAIFSIKPFPLLLSHPVDSTSMWPVAGLGLLAATGDRRLMLWSRRDRGARQVADNLPPGKLLWGSSVTAEGDLCAVVGKLQNSRLHFCYLQPAQNWCSSVPLEVGCNKCKVVCTHNGMLFVVHDGRVEMFDAATGHGIGTLPLPSDLIWARDRFFHTISRDRWYALSHDGMSAKLELVLDERDKPLPKLVGMFDKQGQDGPLGITATGELYFTANSHREMIQHLFQGEVELAAVSPDGSRIVLKGQSLYGAGNRAHGIEVDKKVVTAILHPGDAHEYTMRLGPFPLEKSYRNHFSHVGCSNGVLVLVSRRQKLLEIHLDASNGTIVLRARTRAEKGSWRQVPFKPISVGNEVGYSLKAATWEDGSKAFLDSRGLLHLKSADRSIPETTIVLTDGVLSGWCSDGSLWGLPYYMGNAPAADSQDVFHSAIEAFAGRLP